MSIAASVESAVRRHVQSRVVDTLADLGVDRAIVDVDRPLAHLGLDSIDILELTQILEYEFDVKLFAVAENRLDTVSDAVDIVVARLS